MSRGKERLYHLGAQTGGAATTRTMAHTPAEVANRHCGASPATSGIDIAAALPAGDWLIRCDSVLICSGFFRQASDTARTRWTKRARVVRSAQERVAVRRHKNGHRPAALAGHRLGRRHVHGVYVGALLAADLDRAEMVVHTQAHGFYRVAAGTRKPPETGS